MGNILDWLQERVKHWTKPATSVLIIGTLSDLTRSRTDLVVENALLRQQLIVLNRQVKRPQLTNTERFRLVFLSHFTMFWKQALDIVQPDTLLRWHRELFCTYWRKKSQGKPKISAETIALIEKMVRFGWFPNCLLIAPWQRSINVLILVGQSNKRAKRNDAYHCVRYKSAPSSQRSWSKPVPCKNFIHFR